MNEIIFRLLDGGDVEWVEAGELSTHRCSLADLGSLASGRRCVLVADGQSVSLAMANVPARQRNTILRAVPYALEENFAEDVENLHFAIGNRVASGELPVATVGHFELAEWLEAARSVSLQIVEVVPEALLVPWEEGMWSLMADGDRVIVRHQQWQGFSVDREILSTVLPRLPRDEDDEGPVSLRWFGQHDAPPLEQSEDWILEVDETDVPPLALMAAGYQSGNATINLLQGVYSPKARIGRYLRPGGQLPHCWQCCSWRRS